MFAAKIPLWGEYRTEIKSEIWRSVSDLGHIRNLQMCLSKNFSYFLPHDAAATWCDHLLLETDDNSTIDAYSIACLLYTSDAADE